MKITVVYTRDSKRRGQQSEHKTLSAARKAIASKCTRKLKLTPVKAFSGYAKTWEATCQGTVIADVLKSRKKR